jgi:hypothetical protein
MAKSNGKGRTRREGAHLEIRRWAAMKRWLAGESVRTIGRALKISKSTATQDIELGMQRWRDENRGCVSATIDAELRVANFVVPCAVGRG